MSKLTNDPI